MSRMAALLLLAAPAPPDPASAGAEEVLATYRRTFKPVVEIDCPRDDPDAIVVCGRDPGEPDPNRPPIPYAPVPGERRRLLPGQAPQADAGRNGRYCFTRCADIVGVDIQTAEKIVEGLKRLIEGDD